MFTTAFIENLEENGCRRWTKYGKDRLYLSASALGLDWSCRSKHSGSLGDCTWRGERISNRSGNGLLDILEHAYVDLTTGKLYYQLSNARYGWNGVIISILHDLSDEFKKEFENDQTIDEDENQR